MDHPLPIQGFPPKPGDVTARFVMATEHPMPHIIKNVPMFMYSPQNRCGVFYLGTVLSTQLIDTNNTDPRNYLPPDEEHQYIYSIETTCSGAMPEAKCFNYDNYNKQILVFYGSDRGVGVPGR